MHSHTSISDGKGSIEDAFAWARDQEAIDFLAVTDHPQLFDHEDTANLSQHESEEWQSIKTAAEKYTEEGKFIAIAGYEMSYYDKLSGHLNTFNTEGFLSGSQVSLEQYYHQLEKFPSSISQFNHPGPYWGDFNNFGYYSKERDEVIHLIEVGNGPGTIQDKLYWRVDAYYSKALDKGWHVAPSNGQDNHEKNWGNSNPYRTVVLAKELSQEAIFDGIRAHRVFASEDNNVEVDYSINGYIMGSEIRDTVGAIDINLAITDPDQNDSVHDITVISNGGKVVAYQAYERKDRKVFYQVSLKPSDRSAYYFVKIRQKDGNYIFTAPIWVEK